MVECELDIEGRDEEDDDTSAKPCICCWKTPPRRSTRERRPVDYYGFLQAHLMIHCVPTTFEEANGYPKKATFKEAMGKQMKSLEDSKVWELTTLPPGKKADGCKWVYKVKMNSDGSIERYKARLVA